MANAPSGPERSLSHELLFLCGVFSFPYRLMRGNRFIDGREHTKIGHEILSLLSMVVRLNFEPFEKQRLRRRRDRAVFLGQGKRWRRLGLTYLADAKKGLHAG